MPSISPRALTVFAVLVGGAGGAVVALRSPSPTGGRVTCAPSSTAAPARSSAGALLYQRGGGGAASEASGSSPAPRAPGGDAGSLLDTLEAKLPANEAAVLGTGLLCARGHVAACFQVAHAYSAGRGVHADLERARSFRRRGLNLLVQSCYDKNPEACYALAHLYRTGQGVPQSTQQANGLIQHTRFLCSFTPSPVCSKLGDAGAADGADGAGQTR